MNICLVITNFAPQVGLVATYYENFSTMLSNHGHGVIMIVISYDSAENDDDEILEENNITKVILKKSYHYFKNRYKKYFRPGGFEAHHQMANGFATREWLLKNHQAFKIDIIQTTDYGGPGIFFCDNDLPPVVVFGHGCLSQLCRYNYVKNDAHAIILKKLEMLSFEQADAIMTHSPLNQKDLAELTGRKVEFSIAPWSGETYTEVASVKTNSIAVASGLDRAKGVVIMADAMRICARQYPSIQLKWIGGDTHTADRHQSMSSYLQKNYTDIWDKNFLWKKKISRQATKQELANAAFIVIPSVWTTFCWVALEAASLGKAIIITETTGAVYLFTHKHDALIIPANDPGKLAEAIIQLSNDPQLCVKLGQNAKLMLQQVFDEKQIVEERIKIFRQIIDNRKLHQRTLDEHLNFLKKYTTPERKLYYSFRAFVKRIIGRTRND